MSNKDMKQIKPRLRFPEFCNTEDWEIKELKTVASFFKGKGLPKSAITSSGNSLCIHYGELFTKYSEIINAVNTRTNLEGDCFLSIENDVLMPTSDVTPKGLAKSCCLKLDNIILGGDILVIRPNQSLVFGEYLSRLIRNQEAQVLQVVSGSTVFHLYASSMEKLFFPFPSLQEQQKIADCLSSIDELITVESKKLDTLKIYKKGLMQQLFPAEGETLPKLRFPEFQAAPDWEEKTLKELCSLQAGKFITASEIYEKNQKNLYPCYGGNGLRGFVKSYTHNGTYPLIGRQGALCGNINISEGSFYATEHAVVVTAKKGVNVNWLFYQLVRLNLNQYATGQAQPGLSVAVLDKLYSTIPHSPIEQQKIADYLSSIDELITAENKKLDMLKKHKKGLMQQLFPTMSEL
ncbi:TPA: restriction endonuclease subunit S [Legionella pneumophila]|uniref:restriction endonuclease subunit S n=1 Tax=Legionella pneumophila TaxID=446 RepID=UPI0007AB7F90|nr:restriction endonuclease subunit S [Legionella pneumophila]MDW8902186.1 restriction endonuclease subunit S [Legionella pneumophila]HAT1863422.1 hypothetical protein [Legionella pneumophila]HBD7501001.1 restriction endonuclease subunit S [Legionella pneumophila]HCE5391736.1 restriction endonuclease subunit S [Legionella pneumophila]HCE5481363.1 restriction endonuclease subunit S [Legionella pneumophila]